MIETPCRTNVAILLLQQFKIIIFPMHANAIKIPSVNVENKTNSNRVTIVAWLLKIYVAQFPCIPTTTVNTHRDAATSRTDTPAEHDTRNSYDSEHAWCVVDGAHISQSLHP